jgi:hypothetical protein
MSDAPFNHSSHLTPELRSSWVLAVVNMPLKEDDRTFPTFEQRMANYRQRLREKLQATGVPDNKLDSRTDELMQRPQRTEIGCRLEIGVASVNRVLTEAKKYGSVGRIIGAD